MEGQVERVARHLGAIMILGKTFPEQIADLLKRYVHAQGYRSYDLFCADRALANGSVAAPSLCH